MRLNLLTKRNRATEATAQQLIATGASGFYGADPIDGDRGYTQMGQSPTEQPRWTLQQERAYSIAAYRSNPMATAVIDTHTAFVCGDSGISPESDDPDVLEVVNEYWNDPKNRMGPNQTLFCRDWLMMGEHIAEYLVGETSGLVRLSPISPPMVSSVLLDRGNPLWLDKLVIGGQNPTTLQIASVDDFTGLRTGQVGYFPSWRTLITDRRGRPFMAPILDDLDAYSAVLSNLVDRTSAARWIALHYTFDDMDQKAIDQWVQDRGGNNMPRSGSIEATNDKVHIASIDVQSGSFEDTNTALSVLTNVAGGSGLAKTWLSESEGANRATSMSMAEPVRRRVGNVQAEWLQIQTEHMRYVVDQAVAIGRLPRLMPSQDIDGHTIMVQPSELVRAVGPKIAAADAQITSTVLLNLAQSLEAMTAAGVMSKEAAAIAAQKAWEQFVGRPFPANLAVKSVATIAGADSAEEIERAQSEGVLFRIA